MLVDSGVTPPNFPSIASTVRANPTAGFSIVSYTGNATAGATFAHGLGAQPHMTIHKNRDSSSNGWLTQHIGAGLGSGRLFLQGNDASGTGGSTAYWNDTAPDSNVVTLGSDGEGNGTDDYIAYCFAPVEGYSTFGSYRGNGSGSADGPFVYTGFKPKFIIVKRIDAAANWWMFDSERGTNELLYPNLANAEGDQGVSVFDFNSNGFKLNVSDGEVNNSSGTYVYMAFASHPFKTSRAR